MQAIHSVGSILEQYDTDKKYPVFGFGGKLQESGKPSHCFALNGDIFNPKIAFIFGIEAVRLLHLTLLLLLEYLLHLRPHKVCEPINTTEKDLLSRVEGFIVVGLSSEVKRVLGAGIAVFAVLHGCHGAAEVDFVANVSEFETKSVGYDGHKVGRLA